MGLRTVWWRGIFHFMTYYSVPENSANWKRWSEFKVGRMWKQMKTWLLFTACKNKKKTREQNKIRTWQRNPLLCLSCRPVPYSFSIHHRTLDGGLIGWCHLVSPSCVISPSKSRVCWLASELHRHPDQVDVMICFWRLDFERLRLWPG